MLKRPAFESNPPPQRTRPSINSTRTADFVEPMECELVAQLHEGPQWVYEIKLDGYRAIAVKTSGQVNLLSRRRKSFNRQYPYIIEALGELPNDTVIDGEIVALDESGRPDFNLLQNYRSAAARIRYFVFDLLVHQGHDTAGLLLEERRNILGSLKFSSPRIHLVEYHETSAAEMLAAVKGLGLEGVIAKRKDSRYEPGKRSGAWVKCRIQKGQEFVIGGYFPGSHGFDSIIVGYYRGQDLMYVARTRNGFVPASRRQLFAKFKDLAIPICPFVNLPDTHPSRFGRELDAEAMKKAVWLRPEIVVQIEFLEWTEADRLRHSKFAGLREDKEPRDVVKEHGGEG
jgi:DNA ligase D-like protein (predicted ligase)